MFAAVGALEFAVWKTTGRVVDLSEQFLAHMGKAMYLQPDWNSVSRNGVTGVESQIGGTDGGEYLGTNSDGVAVPLDPVLRYVASYPFSPALGNPYWNKQYNVNKYNFDETVLPLSALNASVYYQGTGYKKIQDGTDPIECEKVLDTGWPMVWDMTVDGDITGPIWQPTTSSQPLGGHAMLIVGYNNRGADDSQKFFWVKNSWGPGPHPNGLTKVSYAYYKKYGTFGHHISGVRTVASPGYNYLGRWKMTSVAINGLFDVSHIPGTSKQPWIYFNKPTQIDKRIGLMMYATSAPTDSTAMFRVNGEINNNGLSFYYSLTNRNQPYWEEPARNSTHGWMRTFMNGRYSAGFLKVGDTITSFAACKGELPAVLESPATESTPSIGEYQLMAGKLSGKINVEVPPMTATPFIYRLSGTIGGRSYSGTARLGNVESMLSGGPFALDKQMWVFDLTGSPSARVDENAPTKVVLIGLKTALTKSMFSGLTSGKDGFILWRKPN